MQPKIFSVVIPTYNRSSNLIKIINRLQGSQISFEIIVCDSNSKDQIKNKIKFIRSKFPKLNLKLINVKQNSNSLKRNTGIKRSVGKYIILLDDDCLPEKNFLRNYYKLLKFIKNKNNIICGSVKYSTNQHNKNFIKYRQSRHIIINNIDKISKKIFTPKNIVTMNMCFEKNMILKKNILFNEEFSRYGFEDYEFGYRLFKDGTKFFFGNPIVEHLDSRNLKTFLKKIKYLAFASSPYLKKINIGAYKKNNFVKLEENIFFKLISNLYVFFYLSKKFEKLIVFIDKKFTYLPFIYKPIIASSYLQGCFMRKQKNKRLSNFENWYK